MASKETSSQPRAQEGRGLAADLAGQAVNGTTAGLAAAVAAKVMQGKQPPKDK
jgi:hypothetical protein